MENSIYVAQKINYNKIPGQNFVLPQATTDTKPTNPVGGQKYYDSATGVEYVYNAVKGRWDCSGMGGRTIRGSVGTESGALANLPTDPKAQDEYIVVTDGDYGPAGNTMHAVVGDSFICITEAEGSTPCVWLHVPSGNGTKTATVTLVEGTVSYSVTHDLGVAPKAITLWNADGEQVLTNVARTATNVTFTFDASFVTAHAGEDFTAELIVG